MPSFAQEGCESVAVRTRGERCLLASVSPPFRTAYWPDVATLASELGFADWDARSLAEPQARGRLLNALADRLPAAAAFRPTGLGSHARPEDIHRREAFRTSTRFVTFLGNCPGHIVRVALGLVADQLTAGASVNVQFKQWDAFAEWGVGREQIHDVFECLYQSGRYRGGVMLFSKLQQLPANLWHFVYEHPRLRIGWLATELLACDNPTALERYRIESVAFKNLETISADGLWPHVVLPISERNVEMLPELVEALLEATRGGSIEIIPAALLPRESFGVLRPHHAGNTSESAGPRAVEEIQVGLLFAQKYVAGLLTIYRSTRLPLSLVAPMSWVATRIDSQEPLASSPAEAGAEVTVLPNGALYASEAAVGLEPWRLGNVLDDPPRIRWERLDLMAESCSLSRKPQECRACDWRYRCGGVDTSVFLMTEAERARRTAPEAGSHNPGLAAVSSDRAESFAASSFPLYCAPRKALLEEILWGSVEAAANRNGTNRELLQLGEEGIDFVPATEPPFAGNSYKVAASPAKEGMDK